MKTLEDMVLERGMTKKELEDALERIRKIKVNVLLIGGTGVGKSSTVNALFDMSHVHHPKAEVGEDANPRTMEITKYELHNMVIWDSPGFGDSEKNDQEHQKKIEDLLNRKDEQGLPLVDLVLLVLDASSRDLESAYKLVKNVIAPQLPDAMDRNRLLIGMNKVDKVRHHSFWNKEENCPGPELAKELEERCEAVKNRIKQDTGFSPEVIYYSAGDIHEGTVYQPPYNLARLLSFILDHLPVKKRIGIAGDMNQKSENFQSNDDRENYQSKIENSMLGSLGSWLFDKAKDVTDFAIEVLKSSEVKKGLGQLIIYFLKKRL